MFIKKQSYGYHVMLAHNSGLESTSSMENSANTKEDDPKQCPTCGSLQDSKLRRSSLDCSASTVNYWRGELGYLRCSDPTSAIPGRWQCGGITNMLATCAREQQKKP